MNKGQVRVWAEHGPGLCERASRQAGLGSGETVSWQVQFEGKLLQRLRNSKVEYMQPSHFKTVPLQNALQVTLAGFSRALLQYPKQSRNSLSNDLWLIVKEGPLTSIS